MCVYMGGLRVYAWKYDFMYIYCSLLIVKKKTSCPDFIQSANSEQPILPCLNSVHSEPFCTKTVDTFVQKFF